MPSIVAYAVSVAISVTERAFRSRDILSVGHSLARLAIRAACNFLTCVADIIVIAGPRRRHATPSTIVGACGAVFAVIAGPIAAPLIILAHTVPAIGILGGTHTASAVPRGAIKAGFTS
jgi:hypothetical protein